MAGVYSNPAYYQKAIPQKQAQQVAARLGISTDQLFQNLAAVGDPNAVKSVGPTTSGGPSGPSVAGTTSVDTSGIEKYIAQQKANTQATAATAQAGAQQSYLGSDPTIRSGSGTIGRGVTGSGGTNMATGGQQPESVALQQIAQIDPTSEALRNQLASSYLTPTKTPPGSIWKA
jgi:hypothetical protein